MKTQIVSVDVECLVNAATKLMIQRDVGSVVVTEKCRPVGIVTQRDILKKCCQDYLCQRVKVREIMSTPLITVDINMPIYIAADLMNEKKIRILLVTEEGELKGIVTQRDLMDAILDKDKYSSCKLREGV